MFPSTSRAGIAVLVCIVACCNLNLFEPHKNKILFWLTQISFFTTAAKYIMGTFFSQVKRLMKRFLQLNIIRLVINIVGRVIVFYFVYEVFFLNDIVSKPWLM